MCKKQEIGKICDGFPDLFCRVDSGGFRNLGQFLGDRFVRFETQRYRIARVSVGVVHCPAGESSEIAVE
ncbi:MAG: hypothetical protein LUH46_05135, partial [Alistipes sp.]|nr:hypothetical protein [Alistipes sp.]